MACKISDLGHLKRRINLLYIFSGKMVSFNFIHRYILIHLLHPSHEALRINVMNKMQMS